MMLLYEPVNPSIRDRWFAGNRFQKQPKEPVIVKIMPKNEQGDLLPYFGTATLMSDDFYKALREAGVDNLDLYEAIIQSTDGSVSHRGYKAFNLIGVVRAADLTNTVFNNPPGTQLIDASIDGLGINTTKAKGLLMFRLAEYLGAVIVHENIKNVLQAKRFPHVRFTEPKEFVS
jgi:hypothetical protein